MTGPLCAVAGRQQATGVFVQQYGFSGARNALNDDRVAALVALGASHREIEQVELALAPHEDRGGSTVAAFGKQGERGSQV